MNKIAAFIKENRRAAGLTQEEFAARSGLGLRFIRELEQGKETVSETFFPERFAKRTKDIPSPMTSSI